MNRLIKKFPPPSTGYPVLPLHPGAQLLFQGLTSTCYVLQMSKNSDTYGPSVVNQRTGQPEREKEALPRLKYEIVFPSFSIYFKKMQAKKQFPMAQQAADFMSTNSITESLYAESAR